MELLKSDDKEKVSRFMKKFLEMERLSIAEIEKAYNE